MNKQILYPARYKGLTLIEIMVAMVIGSFLMLGAMGLFMSNKRIYTEQDEMGRLQENARFAMQLLVDDLRIAGYVGCSDDASLLTNPLTGIDLYDFANPLEGSEDGAAWVPSASADNVSTYNLASTVPDAITIRYIDPISADVAFTPAGTMANASANIPATCTGGNCNTYLTDNEALAISDCAGTDIFSVDVNNTNLNPAAALGRIYTDTAQISRYVTNRYYIGVGVNGPSLFRKTVLLGAAVDQELIEGVESLQVMYGVDNNADQLADSYTNAAGVAGAGGWANVVAVKIAILVRTVNDNPNNEVDTNTYNLLDEVAIDPTPGTNDNRRRRIYSTTVQIRNRT